MKHHPPELNVKKKDPLAKVSTQLKYKQRMMIKYLVAGIPIEEIHSKIQISKNLCRAWLRKESVIKELEAQTTWRAELDAKRRKRRNEFISSELYSILLEKFATGSLEKMNVKSLMKFLIEFNKEIRSDTPGESGKKIHHKIEFSEELAKLYAGANSSAFDQKENKIVDITIPKQLEEPKGDVIDGNQSEEAGKSKETFLAKTIESIITDSDGGESSITDDS